MSTIKDRISQIIETYNMTPHSFEMRCNLTNGYVRGIKLEIGSLKLEQILKNFPDISPDWLILGEGEMLRKNAIQNYQSAQGAEINQSIVTGRPDIATLIEQLRTKDEQIRQLQKQAASLSEMLHYVLGVSGPSTQQSPK